MRIPLSDESGSPLRIIIMQTLFVDEANKEVHIHRAFLDAGGAGIYLHTNGKYLYKDGRPLISESEMGFISNSHQRNAALRWWKSFGEKESIAFYAADDDMQRQLAGDYQPGHGLDPDIDIIAYTRRPSAGKHQPSPPTTWREWFEVRPDWWGQAEGIKFKDFIYEIVRPVAEEGHR